MNEIELLRLYQEQLAVQVRNTELPAHDRNAAAAVLAASRHLTGARLHPRDEPRTWVFSDPHFGHGASVAILDIRNLPGHRILILGNHDVTEADALREAGVSGPVAIDSFRLPFDKNGGVHTMCTYRAHRGPLEVRGSEKTRPAGGFSGRRGPREVLD